MAAHTIGIDGYISGARTQTHSALTSIKVAAGALPAGLFLTAGAVMLAYPLTENAFRRMVAEIAERHADEFASEDAALLAEAEQETTGEPTP